MASRALSTWGFVASVGGSVTSPARGVRSPSPARAIASARRGRSTSSSSGCARRVRDPRLRADRRGGVAMSPMESKTAMLHGRSVSYVGAGAGPVLLLIHGMAGTYENWQAVIEPLARSSHRHRTRSARPRRFGTRRWRLLSLGALAVGLRDLLVTLGHERATLVGHSLGGGIAMQDRLPFPRDHRAPGAGLQRRSRSGGEPSPTRCRVARCRTCSLP